MLGALERLLECLRKQCQQLLRVVLLVDPAHAQPAERADEPGVEDGAVAPSAIRPKARRSSATSTPRPGGNVLSTNASWTNGVWNSCCRSEFM